MKNVVRVLSLVAGVITVLIVLVLVYLKVTYPRSDPPESIIIKPEPRRLQRGKYLSINGAGCIGCYSIRDWTRFAAPPIPGTEGGGGDLINEKNGFFDTDSTHSVPVGKNNFNTPMPWTLYAGMTEADLGAIFEYLQTCIPVDNKVVKWTPARVTK